MAEKYLPGSILSPGELPYIYLEINHFREFYGEISIRNVIMLDRDMINVI